MVSLLALTIGLLILALIVGFALGLIAAELQRRARRTTNEHWTDSDTRAARLHAGPELTVRCSYPGCGWQHNVSDIGFATPVLDEHYAATHDRKTPHQRAQERGYER